MRAASFRGPRQLIVEEVAEPEPGPHDLVLTVGASGICGTDLHSYTHGAFVSPGQVMGHEFAGTVRVLGEAVEGLAVGDRVAAVPLLSCGRCRRCLAGSPHLCETGLAVSLGYGLPGSFADQVLVPQALVGGNVFAIPEAMSMAEAAMVEPLSVALHAAKGLDSGPSEVAVVLGLGSIGQYVVQSLKALGAAHVIGVDVSPVRLRAARALGADTVIDAAHEDVLAGVRAVTGRGFAGGGDADMVAECSGVAEMATLSTHLVRRGGRLQLAAMYGDRVPVDVNAIVTKELQVKGSFAYHGEFAESIGLIASGRVSVAPLITHTFALDDITEAFETQLLKDESVKVVVSS